jgi:hypothetical protein
VIARRVILSAERFDGGYRANYVSSRFIKDVMIDKTGFCSIVSPREASTRRTPTWSSRS